MNLMRKPPLGQKAARAPRDPEYLAEVRALPCCICEAFGYPQTHPTQAHHPICERHGNERVPDHEAIPLCDGHHQGNFDTTKIAIHRDRGIWVERFGSDRDWISPTQDKIEATRAATI